MCFRVEIVLLDIWIYFELEIKLVSCLGVVLKTDLTTALDDLHMYKLMFKKNISFEKMTHGKIKMENMQNV